MKLKHHLAAPILALVVATAPVGAGPGALAPLTPSPLVEAAVPAVYPASGFQGVLSDWRRDRDRSRVEARERLARAAQAHANWLAARGTLSHTGRNGSSAGDRARAAGCNWGAIAENLAAGPGSAREAVRLWAGSPSHRTNMLGRSFRVFGLGRAGNIWVLLLADRC